MNLLRLLLNASRGAVVLAIVAGLCGGASGVVLIALIHRALAGGGLPSTAHAALFAALCLVSVLMRVLSQAAMVRLAQGSVSRLALHVCSKILAMPLERFEQVAPARLTAVLTEDIASVTGALIGVPLLCINLPVVLGCLAYIGWLAPPVLLCGLAVAVPAVFGYHKLAARGFLQLRKAREGQDALVGHFRGLIDGFRELKLHRRRREAFLQESLEAAAASVRDRSVAGFTFFALASGWSQLAFFGIVGGLVFVLPQFLTIDAQAQSGIVLAALYLMSPLDVILTWLPVLARARVSLSRIERLVPSLEGGETDNCTEPLPFCEAIRLADVSYAYGDEPAGEGFVLGPVDLTLRRGEMIFLAGGNGSGKTTFVKLLAGLYTPRAGTLRVDGRPVRPTDCEAFRQLFSVVFADGHLFPSLLGLAHEGLDRRADRLLAQLELIGVVRVEAGRFSTTDLSHGQRKRLALLAACLEDRPVCIFDEWAAYQDPYFKKTFYEEFLPRLKEQGRTLVVVSHDEDYYGVADRVVRLADGLVVTDEAPASIAAERIP
jgi:putative ATP-binding cassette transporter